MGIAAQCRTPVSVERYLGVKAAVGDVYAAAETDYVAYHDNPTLVVNAAGVEVVSRATLHAAPGSAPLYPAGSRVTGPDGITSHVIARKLRTVGPTAGHHVKVWLD